ncbi:putative damage-inducible protein DinB [Catalinimonas alkaloidigena]|uniref:DinB family protein n=1 Tax=Catalinimonas alkaloidigena TaxID=1075417 RepID=UPI0024076424|nr:DinB family protein [Catalinimonas alkaloidigena]MDF9796204.1 putative damage-inducible protein DinB [Catalinimonas alkaloidigena]
MKTMKPLLSIVLGAFLFTYCTPQEAPSETTETAGPSYTFVEAQAPVWEEAIAQIEELANAMPEDMYDYKPHDSVRTFAEQLLHIGGSSKVIANMFLKDVQPSGPPPEMDASSMSKDEVVEYVLTNLREAGEIMSSVSDDALKEETQSFSGRTITRMQGMLLVHDHLTNHKAKANLYVRISGNNPPDYRYY